MDLSVKFNGQKAGLLNVDIEKKNRNYYLWVIHALYDISEKKKTTNYLIFQYTIMIIKSILVRLDLDLSYSRYLSYFIHWLNWKGICHLDSMTKRRFDLVWIAQRKEKTYNSCL